MNETQTERAKRLADEGVEATKAWHKRMAEAPVHWPKPTGREFEDGDPKRDSQSPLGGRVW